MRPNSPHFCLPGTPVRFRVEPILFAYFALGLIEIEPQMVEIWPFEDFLEQASRGSLHTLIVTPSERGRTSEHFDCILSLIGPAVAEIFGGFEIILGGTILSLVALEAAALWLRFLYHCDQLRALHSPAKSCCKSPW